MWVGVWVCVMGVPLSSPIPRVEVRRVVGLVLVVVEGGGGAWIVVVAAAFFLLLLLLLLLLLTSAGPSLLVGVLLLLLLLLLVVVVVVVFFAATAGALSGVCGKGNKALDFCAATAAGTAATGFLPPRRVGLAKVFVAQGD